MDAVERPADCVARRCHDVVITMTAVPAGAFADKSAQVSPTQGNLREVALAVAVARTGVRAEKAEHTVDNSVGAGASVVRRILVPKDGTGALEIRPLRGTRMRVWRRH
jgi:hypothetical protein